MKLKRAMTFKQTVSVQLPTDKLDVVRNESFQAEFKMLSNDELAQQADENAKLSVKDQLTRVLVSVSGIGDEDGKEYPADEARELIMDNPITALAALHSYNKAMSKDILGKTAKAS